ncbi:hypothetical protein F4779DRAFT_111481 [Xylariaceae sp. FL0662B]|nr:hypothetical protein F4779DRAFT_111481 [Xylariaceae sp. FL0662B]
MTTPPTEHHQSMVPILDCPDPTHGGKLQYFPPAEELEFQLGLSLPCHVLGVLENHRLLHLQYHEELHDRSLQISRNYHGNLDNEDNRVAEIDHDQNCALWISALPPNISYHEFLSRIRGAGKVYALVIYPPKPSQGLHLAAAKLRFFDRRGVDAILSQARHHTLTFEGTEPTVELNRIKSAARPAGPESRVLVVEGPARIVNTTFLYDFFDRHLQFELDLVMTEFEAGQFCRQQWHFGSYRQQAQRAHQAIIWAKALIRCSQEETKLWKQVQIWWGKDPCAN